MSIWLTIEPTNELKIPTAYQMGGEVRATYITSCTRVYQPNRKYTLQHRHPAELSRA